MNEKSILAEIGTYGPALVTVAAAAAAAMPKATPGTWYAVFRGVIDVLAGNFGNARNAA